MTAEFGPLDSDDDDVGGGPSAWLSGYMLKGVCRLLSISNEGRIRYLPDANRLAMHGESDNAGNPFRAGLMVMLVSTVGLVLVMGSLVLLGELSRITGELTGTIGVFGALLSATLSVVFTLVSLWTAKGILGRIDSMEVIDHTTPKPDERIEELADGYVDGDLDHEELAAEVETVYEREGGR